MNVPPAQPLRAQGLRRWQVPLLVLTAGALLAAIESGSRSTFGLFLPPLSETRGWSREVFSLAMALQNLTLGLVLPLAAAAADRVGPVRVVAAGASVYALGIWLMRLIEAPAAFQLVGGLLVGAGFAFASFSLVVAAMVRVVRPERRPLVMGVGMAAASLGQVVFSPIMQGFISAYGWSDALAWLALIALAMVPLAFVLPGDPNLAAERSARRGVRAAIREAAEHRGYLLLTAGFFVCGFHVAFISVHLPAYVLDLGFAASVGAAALALIGLFNIVGSLLAGMAGMRFSRRLSLSFIYAARAAVIAAFLLLPKTELVTYVFAALMGLLWLATVPLTTDIVARLFGVRYLATLFSFVFLSHQLGAFTGVWLGGAIYEATGSYDGMWLAGIAFGLAAALIHLPIDERPLPRLAAT